MIFLWTDMFNKEESAKKARRKRKKIWYDLEFKKKENKEN